MQNRRIYPLFLFLMLTALALAQGGGRIELKHADALKSAPNKAAGVKRLVGNVYCVHGETAMRCDSAYLYENRRLEAFGHVSLSKSDGMVVYSDKLEYEAGSHTATLENNVRCIDKETTLSTNILQYNTSTNVASYFNGGTIVSKENTLTSQNGHYNSRSKEMTFRYNVVLSNPNYTMNGDTLRYNAASKIVYFLGPTVVKGQGTEMYCVSGSYDTQSEVCRLSKGSKIMTKEQILIGDSIYYDRKKGYGRVMKNVTIIDTTNKSRITGQVAEYFEKINKSMVTGHPVYAQKADKEDTLYLAADTLFHIKLDSLSSLLKAYHHVRIFKTDMQGRCDSLAYNTKDSVMHMYNTPILWSRKSQATAKRVDVFMGKTSVKGFKLDGNALVIEQVDSLGKFNQISGKYMEGFFVKDTLRKINVVGNSTVLYYPKDKNKVKGLNRTQCSDITLLFNTQGIHKMIFKTKPEGTVTPIKDVNVEEAKLKGFVWLESKRPKSKGELYE